MADPIDNHTELLASTVPARHRHGNTAGRSAAAIPRALLQALGMSAAERAERNGRMVESLEAEDITHWLQRQLEDVNELPG